MSIEVVTGWDATHSNLPHAPKFGQPAGYTTGSSDIVWTSADWAAHPGAVRICQDFGLTDDTADVFDVETGAGTPDQVPGAILRARAARAAGKRKGQREPVPYVNQSNLHLVANALAGAKITGVGIWLADYNFDEVEAGNVVKSASGPYPIIGVQYSDQGGGGLYDLDVWAQSWLDPSPAHVAAWHEYDSAGELSLAGLAAKLNVGIATMLENTIKHYGYLDGPLGNYVKDVFDSTIPATSNMPKGCKFWVFS